MTKVAATLTLTLIIFGGPLAVLAWRIKHAKARAYGAVQDRPIPLMPTRLEDRWTEQGKPIPYPNDAESSYPDALIASPSDWSRLRGARDGVPGEFVRVPGARAGVMFVPDEWVNTP